MRTIIGFNPDPNIPDSDLLGFGDMVYSDGTTEYLSNDPDMAASLPPLPPGMSPQRSQMGPPEPPQKFGPPPLQPEPAIVQGDQGPVQIDMTGNMSPITSGLNSLGNMLSGGVDSGQPSAGLGDMLGNAAGAFGSAMAGGMSPPAQQGAGQGPPPVTIQGEQGPVTIDPTGNITPGASGIPFEQLKQQTSGGMQPVQREGALPPDVAARQASAMAGMQQQTIDATGQARNEEARLYNELVLKQMAANEAERVKREQDLADEQAKVQRWQEDQQAVMDQGIETDLVSARGPVGAVFAAIGATLLGAAGNDAGLRMIEKQIDRHVQLQMAQKDSKLRMLANQIGSSQEAIKLGKAMLYKVAADKTELLAAKTKSDVFEAQSPAIIQQLRQKGLEQLQAAERDSLGKTLEKAPLPAAPPNPAMLEKYGALRRERQGNDSITQRMDQTLGLIWQPGRDGQPGQYVNKAEVLANGIQGTGNLEQLLPDILYSTGGGVTVEGRQVRGAAEAMAFAQLRAVQPTGQISNSDIERAVKMGALDTEDGLLLGLERMHNAAEQQLQHDAAQFGPDVVGEYERRRQQSGGQPAVSGGPVSVRPATTEEKRAAMGSQSKRAAMPDNATASATPEEFEGAVAHYAAQAGLNPEAVSRVIRHESGGKPGVTNKYTGKHAGLIQFSKETWAGLAKDMGRTETWDDMRRMSAEDQLPFVMEYFRRAGLDANSEPGDYAMAGFMPAFLDKPDDFVLGLKDSKEKIAGLSMGKVYAQNPGLQNGDRITVGDVRRSVL